MPGNEIAITGKENLDVDLASPAFSFGFDFVEAENDPNRGPVFVDSRFTVSLLNSGTFIDSFTFNAPNDSAAFVGVLGDSAFDRVEIFETTGGSENEFFGEFYVNSNPPPSEIKAMVDVSFVDSVINSGPLSFGLSALPANPAATIALGEGTLAGGGATTYGLSDVLSANLIFGDGDFTDLMAFDMEVLANGSIEMLSYTFSPFDRRSVTDGIIILNSPLFISGTDTASGQAFSYTYANSVETINFVPEPGDFDLDGDVDGFDFLLWQRNPSVGSL